MLAVAIFLFIILVALVWIVPVFKAVEIAKRKRVSGGWLWGIALGWIGVWVLMAHPSPVDFAIRPHIVAAPDLKKCPRCAELVQVQAKVCRFCQHTFD